MMHSISFLCTTVYQILVWPDLGALPSGQQTGGAHHGVLVPLLAWQRLAQGADAAGGEEPCHQHGTRNELGAQLHLVPKKSGERKRRLLEGFSSPSFRFWTGALVFLFLSGRVWREYVVERSKGFRRKWWTPLFLWLQQLR